MVITAINAIYLTAKVIATTTECVLTPTFAAAFLDTQGHFVSTIAVVMGTVFVLLMAHLLRHVFVMWVGAGLIHRTPVFHFVPQEYAAVLENRRVAAATVNTECVLTINAIALLELLVNIAV